ncbi:MAG: alpha/beta hydrolase, partial [Candidatus Heimdallarchaeota archaeon]|nr:alpha/beta hydrolase [Candidatus Heimdallarchaeota archaeon]
MEICAIIEHIQKIRIWSSYSFTDQELENFVFPQKYAEYKDTGYAFQNHSWIVPSLIGYESSDAPEIFEAYSMEQFSQDLYDLLIHEKVKAVVILGHSMGGMVGTLLIKKLITYSKITISAFYNMEGPLISDDIGDKIGRNSFEYFESQMKQELVKLKQKIEIGDHQAKRGYEMMTMNPNLTIWSVYTHFTKLCDENNLLEMTKEVRNIQDFPIYFVYGLDKNLESRLPSRKLVLKSDFEVMEVPDTGHNMFIE